MHDQLKQLIDDQDVQKLAEFFRLNPTLDLNCITQTSISALWWALNPPCGKNISLEIIQTLINTECINPLQEWYGERSIWNCKSPLRDLIERYEDQYILHPDVNPVMQQELARVAANSQNTHDPLVVKQYDDYILNLYERYGENALVWTCDFDEFVNELGYNKNMSFNRAIRRIKEHNGRRTLQPDSEIALTNVQLLMLVWHALCDTDITHYVDGIDMSLEEQRKRKKLLLDRTLESQHEYDTDSPACFMGTRHKLISTLDKVHRDCSETYKILTRELIEENYQTFCAHELEHLRIVNRDLYNVFIQSLVFPEKIAEKDDTQLTTWANDVKQRFWEAMQLQQKITLPKYQMHKENFHALGELYLAEDFPLSIEKHMPAFMASQLLIHRTLLAQGRSDGMFVFPPVNELLNHETCCEWLKANYCQDAKKISAYLISENVNAVEPLFKKSILQLKEDQQQEVALQLWQQIISGALTTNDIDVHFTNVIIAQLEKLWKAGLGDLMPWVLCLPAEIKYHFFEQLYQEDLANQSLRKIAFNFATTQGRWSEFPVNEPLIFENKDLRGVDLSKLNLKQVRFIKCDLRLTGILSNPTLTTEHLESSITEENTPFIAARRGYLAPMQAYLTENYSTAILNKKTRHGGTVLSLAVNYGHAPVISAILKANSSCEVINARDRYGDTALIRAARKGLANVVTAILEQNASVDVVNAKDRNGNTALMVAAHLGHVDVVRAILEKNSSLDVLNIKDRFGHTPLMEAARNGLAEVVTAILEKNNSLDVINAQHPHGYTALMLAAREGRVPSITAILKKNATEEVLNIPDSKEYTALMWAARESRLAAISAILEINNSTEVVNATDCEGESALMRAARFGRAPVITSILEKDSSLKVINARDLAGDTILIRAARFGRAHVMAAVLEQNSSPEVIHAQDKNGNTALLHVLKNGHDSIQYLIKLFQVFYDMEMHAKKLGEPYASNILPRLKQLKRQTVRYFSKAENQNDIQREFSEVYSELVLQCKGHRKFWKPLLANLLIAATGVGLLVIGFTYLMTGRLGLFSQTKREKLAGEIEKQFYQVATF